MGENWTLHFDGACEPMNPRGIATYGFVLKKAGVMAKEGKGLAAPPGSEGSTNNVAEYTALLRGLEAAKTDVPQGDSLEIMGDSQLAIRQLTGQYAVNAPLLIPIHSKASIAIHDLRMNGRKVDLKWIRREENGEADKLSKEAVKEALQADPGILKAMVLTFGMHKGKSLAEVPKSYLDWLFSDKAKK